MSNIRTVAPAAEPVSLASQKGFMRITVDDPTQDEFLEQIILPAAREYVELHTRLALITQTWKLSLDEYPSEGIKHDWWDGVQEMSINALRESLGWIELPTGPLISVTSFKTFDNADAETVFTGFYTDTTRRPGRVALRSGSVWPVFTRPANGIEITYVAGFGPAAANVPTDLRLCISQIASHWFENRELMTFDTAARDVPTGAQRIINQRRNLRL